MKTWWNILICMWIGVIHGEEHVNGEFELTSSPPTATDGELFTLICSFRNESVVNIGWLQNNTYKIVTQKSGNCSKQPLAHGGDIINRINVNCNNTAHSIAFRFNTTADQGAAWQCGNSVSDYNIDLKSDIYIIDVASHVMSPQTLATSTRHMDTTSDPETVTTIKAVTSSITSSQTLSSTTRYNEATSDPEKQKKETLYIMVGAVGGAVLLIVAMVGIVCIRRRRQATHQQNDMKEERNVISTPGYHNSTSCDIMENELYETSRDVSPINEAENQEDDFMISDAYAGVDMAATNTCTPREQVASGDVNLEDMYAKPDENKVTQVQEVSDIYAEVKKPKKHK